LEARERETMSFYKHNIVKLDPETCFTTEQGGGRDFVHSTIYNDENGIVRGLRRTTPEEQDAWYASDAAKGLDSAGETKLAPRVTGVTLHRDETFTVVRGRARFSTGWGNPTSGWVKIRTENGEECFIRRGLLTHA